MLRTGENDFAYCARRVGCNTHWYRYRQTVRRNADCAERKTVSGLYADAGYALQTGEINKMFAGLSTVESVLLVTHTREVLFRKP